MNFILPSLNYTHTHNNMYVVELYTCVPFSFLPSLSPYFISSAVPTFSLYLSPPLSLSHAVYIHQGHEKEALNLMASYLPKDSANSSPYAEGGGLYAIGIIHTRQ